ncbi:hypothetical protein ACFQ3L_03550 [Lacticaseibacillus jixianensis]|uniref:Uncharacterized protein n=1 Tax=Lacticaseibacillus jixianensis TaxID=2486012 RepID=A0ABW4B8N3_9LACO|nr:hypothetical protein [Lacticaseibacillus jixianensis]
MAYSVIGATYQHQSLAVFYSGLDGQQLLSFTAACREALRLLNAELAACPLPDIRELAEQVLALALKQPLDLHQLAEATGDTLSLSWFADDHFVIAVMDRTEAFQLHLEVVPVHAEKK